MPFFNGLSYNEMGEKGFLLNDKSLSSQKGHLIIDEETAPIVRKLFEYVLDGHGSNWIRRRLEKDKVPCPTWYNRQKGLRNVFTKWERMDPENGKYMWDFAVIEGILSNPVYIGTIASQKFFYKFKIGTLGEKKPEDWIAVEDMHEPIIDKAVFETVQEKRNGRRSARVGADNISLFAGCISEDNFNLMLSKAQKEQDALKEKVKAQKQEKSSSDTAEQTNREWFKLIKKYKDLDTLTPELLNRLIKCIDVSEEIREDGTRDVSLEIHFNVKNIDTLASA